jgi:hypothetical protein
MLITLSLLLALTAFVCAVGAAAGKVPLWVAVVLLAVLGLVGVMPR